MTSEVFICRAFFKEVMASKLVWKQEFELIHVANERKCTPMQGAMLKAMGVKAGVADYVVFANQFTGFIEFKKPKGRQTDSQRDFQARVESFGMPYRLAYSVNDGISILQEWGLMV